MGGEIFANEIGADGQLAMTAINELCEPNAARAADSIRSALSVGELERNPEVLLVSAHDGSGIEQLVDAIDAVETTTGRERLRIRERLISAWDSTLLGADSFDEVMAALETGSMTLSEAVESIRKG
jgi:putative protein kinase ArgK-like GTPase of G3E family